MFFLKELPTRQMVEGYADRIEDLDPSEVQAALETMRAASQLIRELEAYFASHNLSQLRFLAMIVIDREPERNALTAGEIADRLDVSRPVLTRTLRTLDEAGLVAIRKNGLDARSKEIALTSDGEKKLAMVLPAY